MLHEHERWIQLHHLIIDTTPEHAPAFTIEDLMPKLKARVDSGDSIKMYNNETASIRIAQMEYAEDDSHVKLLLQYADKKATDPVFMDLVTCDLRTAHKLEGEGIAVSSHVVIGLTQDSSSGTYPLLLEEVPGLGRTNIQKFLRSEFKTIAQGHFQFRDESDNDKVKNYRPVARVLDEPSASFVDDLDTGTVDGIELVKRTPAGHGDFDEAGYFLEECTIVRVAPLRKRGIIGNLNALRQKAADAGFSNLKVKYTKPAGKRRTAIMGTDIQDLQSACVVRTEMVKSETPLPQCGDEIEMDFADSIADLL